MACTRQPRSAGRRGFTFIEVLACLLVLAVGVGSAAGMAVYGVTIASRAQARATAMATALTVAVDPTPLLPTGAVWTAPGAGSGDASGWINGYWVVRRESIDTRPAPGFTAGPVHVDVYEAVRGRLVASYSTRVVRQESAP